MHHASEVLYLKDVLAYACPQTGHRPSRIEFCLERRQGGWIGCAPSGVSVIQPPPLGPMRSSAPIVIVTRMRTCPPILRRRILQSIESPLDADRFIIELQDEMREALGTLDGGLKKTSSSVCMTGRWRSLLGRNSSATRSLGTGSLKAPTNSGGQRPAVQERLKTFIPQSTGNIHYDASIR
jgi:hypothetical protein